jgi:hypothetical protein
LSLLSFVLKNVEPKKLGSTLSLLAQLGAGPKTEPKGPNFGPKIGSTLSLSTQITAKQNIST